MPFLRHSAPGQQSRIILLLGDLSVIGRSKECDIVLEDGNLSRHHCQIRKWAGFYKIEDLKSKNGTYVNGEKVTAANLSDGDLIVIGDQSLVFKHEQMK